MGWPRIRFDQPLQNIKKRRKSLLEIKEESREMETDWGFLSTDPYKMETMLEEEMAAV
jgi:hypothetical protein